MKQTSHRNLILEISEINEQTNVFSIILNMMLALKNNEITSSEYDLLAGELQFECIRQKIATSNEICSLF